MRPKLHSPDEDWKLAFAAKKEDHFEFLWMKILKKDRFKFDDEMKSLLSANLWEIGWYSLLQGECESEIGTEKPGGISVIDRNAI